MNTRRNTLRLSLGLTLSATAAAAALLAAPSTAMAQGADAWPSRPIKLIVPYAAGGFADTRARKIADKIGQSLGQPIVIDNRGGAGGVTGTDAIAKATDGHTFGFGSPGPLVTNPMLMKKLPYNAARDLQPIILIEEAPLILTTAPNQPFKTVAELVAAAKAKPGTLTYASSGDGSPQHLAGLMFESRTGTRLLHVPYKGGAPAITDLIGGVVDMAFAPLPEALPHIKAGKLFPIGVLSEKRAVSAPDIPTLREGGVDNVVLSAWIGLLAPAKTPQPILDRLNQSVKSMLRGDARTKLLEVGMEPAVDDVKPLGQVIREEIRIHAELVKAAGLVPQ